MRGACATPSARSRASARRRWSSSSRSARPTAGSRILDDFAAPRRSAPAQPPPARERSPAAARSTGSPKRRQVSPAAETILADAASAADARDSGQGGLFGEARPPSRRSAAAGRAWTIAERMAAEKEASASISRRIRSTVTAHLAGAHGARTFAELAAIAGARRTAAAPADDGGAGRGGALAHLGAGPALSDGDAVRFVGPVRGDLLRRSRSPSSRRLRPRPAAAPCSTSSSTAARARRRRASPIRSLPAVRGAGEAHPRCSSRSRPTTGGARPARRRRRGHGGGRGELRPKREAAAIGQGRLVAARPRLPSLDAELAARIERIPGVTAVRLAVAEAPRLALGNKFLTEGETYPSRHGRTETSASPLTTERRARCWAECRIGSCASRG